MNDKASSMDSAHSGSVSGERELPEGGYCFDCRIAFDSAREADTHYAMTGHEIGWPLKDVDWPLATPEQVMGGRRS